MNFKEIKQLVSVPQALNKYTSWDGEKRIKCFIHDGEHNNMIIHEEYYYCFVCGAKGDVVELVAQLHNINKSQAIKTLENDFTLNKNQVNQKLIINAPKTQYVDETYWMLTRYSLVLEEGPHKTCIEKLLDRWLEWDNARRKKWVDENMGMVLMYAKELSIRRNKQNTTSV